MPCTSAQPFDDLGYAADIEAVAFNLRYSAQSGFDSLIAGDQAMVIRVTFVAGRT